MKMRHAIPFFLLLILAAAPVTAAPPAPVDQIRQTVDAVIALLKNKGMDRQERREKLSTLVRARFDFEVMSQWALGKNWRSASPQERSRFISLFSDLLEETYVGRIEDYTDEAVVYLGEKRDGERAEVETQVLSGNTDIPIRYKVRLKGEEWFVYDVVIEEVSLVRNFRSSYDEIIRKEGMGGLLKKMEEKILELRNSKGGEKG